MVLTPDSSMVEHIHRAYRSPSSQAAGYRVEAAFTLYPQPKQLKIPIQLNALDAWMRPGNVTFRLN